MSCALQRAGVAENPAEKQNGKWTAEGKVKGVKSEYPRRTPALKAGCVTAHPIERAVFYGQLRWYRRCICICPLIDFRGQIFFCAQREPVFRLGERD